MSTSRNNKSKSSGLRILWIPGGRKKHTKGHYDTTNKNVSYSSQQKRNEMWSLGGSKTQRNLIEADTPDTPPILNDGPSVSGFKPITCAIGAVSAAGSAATCNKSDNSVNAENVSGGPITPNSTASTVLLLSTPNSPFDIKSPSETTIAAPSPSSTLDMPTIAAAAAVKTTTTTLPPPIPVIITTTTTAEIMDENRFAILSKDIADDVNDFLNGLPKAPSANETANPRDTMVLNTSAETTASVSTATTQDSSSSPPKSGGGGGVGGGDEKVTNSGGDNSPTKQKHRTHNNNNHHQQKQQQQLQSDINSIESISDNTKLPNLDLEWVDELALNNNSKEMLHRNKRKKKKLHAKELDQLDGVPNKMNQNDEEVMEDEKVVKCLYYTLMCCECTIS